MTREVRIEIENFNTGSMIGANFDSYSNISNVNGNLAAVKVLGNNYAATGSLLITESGTGLPLWSIISGTATGNAAQSGIYYVTGNARDLNNNIISGTTYGQQRTDVPLFGTYRLTGSGLGANKSGLGINMVYRMG